MITALTGELASSFMVIENGRFAHMRVPFYTRTQSIRLDDLNIHLWALVLLTDIVFTKLLCCIDPKV